MDFFVESISYQSDSFPLQPSPLAEDEEEERGEREEEEEGGGGGGA